MRILKGYSKGEQNELKDFKKTLDITDLLHIITGLAPDTGCGLIWRRYDKAGTDERISIIKDILDFYTDKAKFAEPKKYYIKMPKVNYPYLIRDMGGKFDYAKSPDVLGSRENRFTEQEIKDIDPRYMAFAEPVEEDNEW